MGAMPCGRCKRSTEDTPPDEHSSTGRGSVSIWWVWLRLGDVGTTDGDAIYRDDTLQRYSCHF